MNKDKQRVYNGIQKNRSILGKWILPILSVLAVSAFPAMFMYFQNADEAEFAEVVVPLIIFIATGAVFFVLFLIISKNTSKSAVIASMFVFVLLNYSLLERGIQKIFPGLNYWHVIMLSLFILGHIAWFVCKKASGELVHTVTMVMCIVFCGLILFNGITAAPTIIDKVSFRRRMVKEQEIKMPQTDENGTKLPNFYYLIFDEFSTNDFMLKYYNYDNSIFTNKLEEMGFNVSHTSHNNSSMTSTVVTNYVNLDYVVNDTTPNYEKEQLRHNNKLFEILKSKGYHITGVGSAIDCFGLDGDIDKSSSSVAVTAEGKTMKDMLLNNTAAYPFISFSYSIDQEIILNALNYMKTPQNFPKNSAFTMFYIVCPHEPFYFDAQGNTYAKPTSNWKDQQYYLGQFIYITNQIIEVAASIIENNPDCIIVLQSDHSARASTDTSVKFDSFDMTGILNAVYFNGEKLDISGLSGVDTIKKVLTKLLSEIKE
jgi:hypothetical protein